MKRITLRAEGTRRRCAWTCAALRRSRWPRSRAGEVERSAAVARQRTHRAAGRVLRRGRRFEQATRLRSSSRATCRASTAWAGRWTAGGIVVDGHAGDYAGGCMTAAQLVVEGNAGLLAACEMAGGTARPSTATWATSRRARCRAAWTACAAARSSSGATPARASATACGAARAIVLGNAGDFLGVAHGGRHDRASAGAAARIVGCGMRRGSDRVRWAAPAVAPIPSCRRIGDADVFWQSAGARPGAPRRALRRTGAAHRCAASGDISRRRQRRSAARSLTSRCKSDGPRHFRSTSFIPESFPMSDNLFSTPARPPCSPLKASSPMRCPRS